uniref:Uncharacterized protein n=1 Tax=viral metagenome TaxID=1070528 RepID=A0A6C0HT00_9ZZZZ
MKGGTFTVDQLMNLFNIFTKNQDYKTLPFQNIEILDKKKYYLYNNRLHVYVLFNSPPENLLSRIEKDMKSVRIVIIHRGTLGVNGFRTRKNSGFTDKVSRFFGSLKDWTNNLRNLTVFNDKIPKTYRQEKAMMGHIALNDYLTKLMSNNIESIISSNENKNIKYMKLLLFSCLKKYKNPGQAVSSFLKTRLSTLGFSQGAVYAYLYGDEGKETIVYNPAPFRGKKPSNTFILKTKNDAISYFVNNDGLPIIIKNTKSHWSKFVKNHTNDILLNDNEKIGIGLFTRSKKVAGIR